MIINYFTNACEICVPSLEDEESKQKRPQTCVHQDNRERERESQTKQ